MEELDGVELEVGVMLWDSVLVVLGVPELLGVTEALPPKDSVVVGVLVCDDERLGVDESLSITEEATDGVDVVLAIINVVDVDGVPLAEPQRDRVVVGVGVGEAVADIEFDPVPESEPVFDELAPAVSEAVGVRETDLERLIVGLGVIDGVSVLELDGVPVGVPLPLTLAVTLGVSEILAVTLALAPRVTEGVADCERDALRVKVEEGVDEDVPVLDEVPDPEPVCEGVSVGVADAVNVAVDEGDGDREDEGVLLAEPPAERVVVGVAVTVEERLGVDESLSLPDGVCVGVRDSDPVPVAVGDAEPVGVADSVEVVEPVPESELVRDELTPTVSEAVGEDDKDWERVKVELGVMDDVSEPEPDGVPVGVALGLSEMLGVTLALAPNVTEGVAELESVSEVEAVTVAVQVCVGVAVSVSVDVALEETSALRVPLPETAVNGVGDNVESAAVVDGNELALVFESRVALGCADGVATDALEKIPLPDTEGDGIKERVIGADVIADAELAADALGEMGGETEGHEELVTSTLGMFVIDSSAEGVTPTEADGEAALEGEDAAVIDAEAEIEELQVGGRHVIRTAPAPPLEYVNPPFAAT